MESNLKNISPKRKKGSERFHLGDKSLDIELLEFWQWSTSDIISNTTRGILAEFLVAKALGIDEGVCNDWGPYDLDYRGLKIEVKASAYLQSWYQDKLSIITFDICPKRAWDYYTNQFGDEVKRHSDVYVFCLLNHQDKSTIDPLNLEQWDFFILETKVLDDKIPTQKSITLSSLKKLNPIETGFVGLKSVVDGIIDN